MSLKHGSLFTCIALYLVYSVAIVAQLISFDTVWVACSAPVCFQCTGEALAPKVPAEATLLRSERVMSDGSLLIDSSVCVFVIDALDRLYSKLRDPLMTGTAHADQRDMKPIREDDRSTQ